MRTFIAITGSIILLILFAFAASALKVGMQATMMDTFLDNDIVGKVVSATGHTASEVPIERRHEIALHAPIQTRREAAADWAAVVGLANFLLAIVFLALGYGLWGWWRKRGVPKTTGKT
jgi:hypothetical protein